MDEGAAKRRKKSVPLWKKAVRKGSTTKRTISRFQICFGYRRDSLFRSRAFLISKLSLRAFKMIIPRQMTSSVSTATSASSATNSLILFATFMMIPHKINWILTAFKYMATEDLYYSEFQIERLKKGTSNNVNIAKVIEIKGTAQ